jgi:polyferredoxin
MSRCAQEIEDPSPATPLAGAVPVKRSRAARWRAGVLIAVHVLLALHIGHWLATGSSVTPLEPSEAMEFSKEGIVNAGAVLFLLAILSTLVLGRWFCGWACHVVALQDACRWLLGKVGIRPKPVNLGLLAVVPWLAFVYMFLAPPIQRLLFGQSLAATGTHFTTSDFWATFPGLVTALVTFGVCGFAIVYLLGAKGFCTYGCPYGGIFGVVDQLAPLRIRVTDACEGCGHCTVACSLRQRNRPTSIPSSSTAVS